jgi:hypothetical protein
LEQAGVGVIFKLPLCVRLGKRLLFRVLPKTGSTVAKRQAIMRSPASLWILIFIRSV